MIEQYLEELWSIMLDLSPSLLLGLLIAGVVHVFLPKNLIRQALNQPNMGSVLRSVLIGVPMPLCSCGVIPTAMGLKHEGASKGATAAFLISTPQTGVDSILVSAVFLGWPFAIFKVIAAFVTGLVGGGLVNRFTDGEAEITGKSVRNEKDDRVNNKIFEILRYAIFDLLAVIDLWIIAGVLVAAAITTAIPTEFLSEIAWTQGVGGMLLVLAVSIPLYVCTTSSVPIAASLVAAGMPTGTALVFLMAGPATNVATIGAVYRVLGWQVLTLYLGTVIVMSIGLGLTFDFVLGDVRQISSPHEHGAHLVSVLSALLLIGLLLHLMWLRFRRKFQKSELQAEEEAVDMTIKVEGMSCQHCVANVKHALESVDQVNEANPDLSTGFVKIKGGDLDISKLTQAVESAGYKVVSKRH